MSIRRTAGAAALALIAPVTLAAGSAQGASVPPSSITVKTSDSTPASGQAFLINGMFTAQGKPADHYLVKAQSLDAAGHWVQLAGAQVDTTSTGTYQLHLILSAKGVRQLRVMGVVPGPAPDAFKRFTVTVH
jgi:hypothetical protein